MTMPERPQLKIRIPKETCTLQDRDCYCHICNEGWVASQYRYGSYPSDDEDYDDFDLANARSRYYGRRRY